MRFDTFLTIRELRDPESFGQTRLSDRSLGLFDCLSVGSDLVTVATSAGPAFRYRIFRPITQGRIDPLAIVRPAREWRSRLEGSRVAPQECLELGQRHVSPVLAECKGFGHCGSV